MKLTRQEVDASFWDNTLAPVKNNAHPGANFKANSGYQNRPLASSWRQPTSPNQHLVPEPPNDLW
jgi:hypothetical protein